MIEIAVDCMIWIFVLWIIAVCVRLVIGPGIENRLVALNVLAGLAGAHRCAEEIFVFSRCCACV